jgi:hypothetical protein
MSFCNTVIRDDFLNISANHCTIHGHGCKIQGDYNTLYGSDCIVQGSNNTNFGKNNYYIEGNNNQGFLPYSDEQKNDAPSQRGQIFAENLYINSVDSRKQDTITKQSSKVQFSPKKTKSEYYRPIQSNSSENEYREATFQEKLSELMMNDLTKEDVVGLQHLHEDKLRELKKQYEDLKKKQGEDFIRSIDFLYNKLTVLEKEKQEKEREFRKKKAEELVKQATDAENKKKAEDESKKKSDNSISMEMMLKFLAEQVNQNTVAGSSNKSTDQTN